MSTLCNEDDSSGGDSSENEYYDNEDDIEEEEHEEDSNEPIDSEVSETGDDESSYSFEDQGSSDEESLMEKQLRDFEEGSEDELKILDDDDNLEAAFETVPRRWTNRVIQLVGKSIDENSSKHPETNEQNNAASAAWMHTDDFSSDEDEDGIINRIGRVPLHWYDDYDHIGYNVHGTKMLKSRPTESDIIDQSLMIHDNALERKFVVYDALHAKDVQLTSRQIDLIRRMQAGAFAHPEFQAYPDFVDYFSGVDREISGINSDRHELKARFQPSKFEKAQVRRWLLKLKRGDVTLEFLQGKVRDMNDARRKDKENDGPFLLWKGDEEDALNDGQLQHLAAPKLAPPSHAESYNPAEEYLPTEEETKEWAEMDVKDRPHGLLIPKKFSNLRSVGAYEHAVRERFERCLDLYLCPRTLKRRLNIDPESLVPSLPKASDLRPFPTSLAIRYDTPCLVDDDPPVIRCLGVSPNGQFLISGASDGYVRLWEVQTGRLMRSWDLSLLISGHDDRNSDDDTGETGTLKKKPVVLVEWNPNCSHHCVLAVISNCVIVIATGTGSQDDAELTEALLSASITCTKDGAGTTVTSAKAAKVVKWRSIEYDDHSYGKSISAQGGRSGPIVVIETTTEINDCKWQRKGDYFLTVSPKAGSAALLIHQLSKANSQQPFGKSKGEVQCAIFHPNKPYLFVATQQHIRLYHLVKQTLVKRLLSGCKWISTIDVHSSGDHIIAGSLDRRLVWFDLDLSSTPYKTLKYHEKALRCVRYHSRYPLMASASDDGTVHVFHSMVYSDLMRNPLIVPVKILKESDRGGNVAILSLAFHPTQPWLFTAGDDGRIYLYQDI
jgi:ribosome biogenesis protein ERB1